jgi:hypothetical protein
MQQRTDQYWLVEGQGSDIDEAYDAAKAAALDAWGNTFPGANLYPDDFEVFSTPRPLDLVVRELTFSKTPRAFALSNPRDWATRRDRVIVTDPTVALPVVTEPTVLDADAALDTVISARLAVSKKPLDHGDIVSKIVLDRIRQRSKVQITRYPAPSQKRFGVFAGTTLLATEPSSSLAAKKARELASEHGTTQVFAVQGREGELPLLEAKTSVVSQRAVLIITLVRQKNVGKNRLASWLFALPIDFVAIDFVAKEVDVETAEDEMSELQTELATDATLETSAQTATQTTALEEASDGE